MGPRNVSPKWLSPSLSHQAILNCTKQSNAQPPPLLWGKALGKGKCNTVELGKGTF